MKAKFFALAMILVLFSGVALAADVSGTWVGEFHTNEGGVFEVTLTLKADGSALTGTFRQGGGEEVQIQNGKAEGNIISFSITRSNQERTRTQKVNFTGTIDGNQMKLARQIEGGQRALEMTLTRK